MRSSFREYKFDLRKIMDMSLFGAFPNSGFVRFSLYNEGGELPDAVNLVIHADGWNQRNESVKSFPLICDRRCKGREFYYIDIDFRWLLGMWDLRESGLFYYHYHVVSRDGSFSLGGEEPTLLSEISPPGGERQLLVYSDEYGTSSEFTEGVIYHIFVDRFRKSGKSGVKEGAILDNNWDGGIPEYGEYPGAELKNNVFFGGDLYGICEKLNYIASLGVKTIYLSPIFDAYSNHKYDTGNYMSVDPMFGGDLALLELCSKAEKLGINVILDGVFNHTGDDSIYFNKYKNYSSVGAYQGESSPYYDWYKFGFNRDDYESWWGIKILPRVDSNNRDFRRFVCRDVVNKWMNMGVSGWRLDVADELAESFLCDFRKAVKAKNKDAVVIGEVWEDASNKISYGKRREYLFGSELDSVMNYPLRQAIIEYVKYGNCDLLKKCTEGTYRRYPKCTSDNLMNFLGTHDTERIITVLGGESSNGLSNAQLSTKRMSKEERARGVVLLKLAYSIIAGLPGVPCVFYGDETGLEGYHDPFCRMPFPWNRMDLQLVDHYRKIGNLRKNNKVFRDGLFSLIHVSPEHLVYLRSPYSEGESKVLFAASRQGTLTLSFDTKVYSALNGKEVMGEYTLSENEAEYFICPADMEISQNKLINNIG